MTRRLKLKPEDALSTLARLGADGKHPVHLRPKAGQATIRAMQADARRHLGETLPESYVAFLYITNGVQINGAYFKEAENLVPENLDLNQPEFIVLGNEGNGAEYIFDKRDRRFHTINMGFPEERFASYDSFEEMLIEVLREQQAL